MQNKDIKILIADDELDILEYLSKAVIRRGYQVVMANDGQEAWEKIQLENPDVILLDINMPGLNGFEVLQRVRGNLKAEKWQPVIIISARAELADMKQSFDLEADHYITKPCQMEDVLKAIRLMLDLIPHRKEPSDL